MAFSKLGFEKEGFEMGVRLTGVKGALGLELKFRG